MAYQCRTCKYFEDAGENEKGYCSWYRSYYYGDESCSHWEGSSGGGGGCFFTSACCAYKGLPDDCEELTRLRAFRDTKLRETEWGRRCIALYEKEAPRILQQIEACENRDKILDWIYGQIKEILALLDAGKEKEAVIHYLLMVVETDSTSRI